MLTFTNGEFNLNTAEFTPSTAQTCGYNFPAKRPTDEELRDINTFLRNVFSDQLDLDCFVDVMYECLFQINETPLVITHVGGDECGLTALTDLIEKMMGDYVIRYSKDVSHTELEKWMSIKHTRFVILVSCNETRLDALDGFDGLDGAVVWCGMKNETPDISRWGKCETLTYKTRFYNPRRESPFGDVESINDGRVWIERDTPLVERVMSFPHVLLWKIVNRNK